MLPENDLPWKMRLRELLIDYICIAIYLVILFGIMMGIYLLVLNDTPEFSELQLQFVAAFASVIPIILIFSILDYGKGSIGKRRAGLKLYYHNKNFSASLLRNIMKFLPWQLAHIGVIRGVYNNFDIVALIFTIAGMILAFVMLMMGLMRKDKRHFGDLVAGTQIQRR